MERSFNAPPHPQDSVGVYQQAGREPPRSSSRRAAWVFIAWSRARHKQRKAISPPSTLYDKDIVEVRRGRLAMATAFRWGALGLVRHLFESGTCAGLSDARLLERFVTHRDEAAFAALLARHGSLVLNTCRTVLKDLNAADDAFQATFVLLFRKAGSIRGRDAVGAWLHRVAYRTALEAQSAAARRREVEQAAGRLRGVETRAPDDSGAVLHEEIERLPDRFRLPVVLCDLEGLTRDQAADHLGCTEGALRNRLAKGRDLLRRRLTRRGITGAVPFVAPPSLPESLLATTLRAAAGDASEAVATLVTAAMPGWILGRFWATAVVMLTLALGTAVALWGAGFLVPGGTPPTTRSQPVQAPAAPPRPRRHPLPLSDRRRPPRSPPSPKRSPSTRRCRTEVAPGEARGGPDRSAGRRGTDPRPGRTAYRGRDRPRGGRPGTPGGQVRCVPRRGQAAGQASGRFALHVQGAAGRGSFRRTEGAVVSGETRPGETPPSDP